jgi:hypothetical protein
MNITAYREKTDRDSTLRCRYADQHPLTVWVHVHAFKVHGGVRGEDPASSNSPIMIPKMYKFENAQWRSATNTAISRTNARSSDAISLLLGF